MKSHVSFWLGVIFTLLLSVPIVLGAWGLTVERALDMAVALFGVIGAFVVLGVLVLWKKDWILRKLTGATKSSLEDVVEKAAEFIGHATDGSRVGVKKSGSELVGVFVNWYSWSGFYRWVVATIAGILITFTGIAGSILLFQQNELIKLQTDRLEEQNVLFRRQNALEAQTMVDGLRKRLVGVNDGRPVPSTADPRSFTLGACFFKLSNQPLKTGSNPAEIDAIEELAHDEDIGEQIQSALNILTADYDSSVAIGAMMVLDRLGLSNEKAIQMTDIRIDKLKLTQGWEIHLHNSELRHFDCENCQLRAYQSSVGLLNDTKFSNIENSIIFWDVEKPLRGGGEFYIEDRYFRRTSSPIIYLEQESAFSDPVINSIVGGIDGDPKTFHLAYPGSSRRSSYLASDLVGKCEELEHYRFNPFLDELR